MMRKNSIFILILSFTLLFTTKDTKSLSSSSDINQNSLENNGVTKPGFVTPNPEGLRSKFSFPIIRDVDFKWIYDEVSKDSNITFKAMNPISFLNTTLNDLKFETNIISSTISADANIMGENFKIGPLHSEIIDAHISDDLSFNNIFSHLHVRFKNLDKPIINMPLIGLLNLEIDALNLIYDQESKGSIVVDGRLGEQIIQSELTFDGNYIILSFNSENISLDKFDRSLKNSFIKDILLSGKFSIKILVNPLAKGLTAVKIEFDKVKVDMQNLKNKLGPLFEAIPLKNLSSTGSIDSQGIMKLQINLDSGLSFEQILTLDSSSFLFEHKIGSTTGIRFNLKGKGKIKLLNKEIPVLLDSDFSEGKGLIIQGSINAQDIDKSDIPEHINSIIDFNKSLLTYNNRKRILSISSDTTIMGLNLITSINMLHTKKEGTKIEISTALSPQIKEYYPFKDSSISDPLKKIKIHDLSLKSNISYSPRSGLTGVLELDGKIMLGELLGKSEELIKSNTTLQSEISAISKINIGSKPSIIIDASLQNIPKFSDLFPDLLKNVNESQEYRVTNPKTGEFEKEIVGINAEAKKGLIDFLDIIKIRTGKLILSSIDNAVVGDNIYDKGLSISAKLDIDLAKDNAITKLLSGVLKITGKDPASLELTGNIDIANLRSSKLTITLGSGGTEVLLPGNTPLVKLKSGEFGLSITGTPSISIIGRLTIVPMIPGQLSSSSAFTPIELEVGVDFSIYKVGLYSSMKNIWKEPFGIKGFAFGDLGARWTQDYITLSAAIASTAAAVTGIGAVGTLAAWANAIFLPTDIGLAGTATFFKGGNEARNQEREFRAGEIQRIFEDKIKEDKYEDVSEEEQEVLKEQIFIELLYSRSCGSRGRETNVKNEDNYICSRLFLNIGKDFTKFGLDMAIENPITFVDLLDFIAKQMDEEINLSNLVPLKLKQVTLKFVPFGTEIGSIKADQGLGASGIIEILGREACFVMGIDWKNGIILKGKMPSINIGDFKLSGAHCESESEYFVACNNKEREEFEKLQKDDSRDNCKRGQPTIAAILNLKEQRFAVSGNLKLGIFNSLTDIIFTKDKASFNIDTKLDGVYRAQLKGTFPSAIQLLDSIDDTKFPSVTFEQLKDFNIELTIKDNIADALQKAFDNIKKDLNNIGNEVQRFVDKAISDLSSKIGLGPLFKIAQKGLEEIEIFKVVSNIGSSILDKASFLVKSFHDLVSIQEIHWKGTLIDLAEGTIKTPTVKATILGNKEELKAPNIDLNNIPKSIEDIANYLVQQGFCRIYNNIRLF